MSEIWFEHEGTRLFAVDRGAGFPIILLHGGLADHRATAPYATPLAARFRAITPDLRGSGRSHFAGPLSFDALADDIAALARHLELERFVVCGISFGAAVAVRVALRHRVAGLIVLHPAYAPGLTPLQQQAMAAMHAAAQGGIAGLRPLFAALPEAIRARAI